MPKSTTHKAVERKLANSESISTKLTDAPRIVLSRAVQRADGAATLPERMTEKAAQKLAATLIQNGLARRNRGKSRHANMAPQRGGTRLRLDRY
jgi:hypothetical protein